MASGQNEGRRAQTQQCGAARSGQQPCCNFVCGAVCSTAVLPENHSFNWELDNLNPLPFEPGATWPCEALLQQRQGFYKLSDIAESGEIRRPTVLTT